MNDVVSQEADSAERVETGSGAEWAPPRSEPTAASVPILARWRALTADVRLVAERDSLSKSEVARRADVPIGTFSPWYDGTYPGSIHRINERVEKWLRSLEDRRTVKAVQSGPGFVETRTARAVIEALVYAQAAPEMVVITLGAGMGKTMTAQYFASTRAHVVVVTMRPTTAGVRQMLSELAIALNVYERAPSRMDRAIGERLRRNGRQTLLIIDEAQNLVDSAVNQLRYFLDEYQCGIALLGNEELYGRFGGDQPSAAYAQLHRRIGMRLRRLHPLQADIDAVVAAWDLQDPDAAKLARAIGRKPGALSQVSKTLTLAGMIAAGEQKELSAEHVRQAWINRGGEDLLSVLGRRS